MPEGIIRFNVIGNSSSQILRLRTHATEQMLLKIKLNIRSLALQNPQDLLRIANMRQLPSNPNGISKRKFNDL